MAPGIAGNVYAFDLRFKRGELWGDGDEVQPLGNASADLVNIRWDTKSPFLTATLLLRGVAQAELPQGYQKIEQKNVRIQSSNGGYFWDHVQRGHGSGLILLLPSDYTLAHDVVPPISTDAEPYTRLSAKEYGGRIAILYVIEPTVGIRNLRTTWRMSRANAPIPAEVDYINSLPASGPLPSHITVDREAPQPPVLPTGDSSSAVGKGSWKHPTVLAALITLVGALVTGYWQFVYKPAHEAAKTVHVGFVVKERGTDKFLKDAQVILRRSTTPDEQQTDRFGSARFEVSPKKEPTLQVTAHAVGYVEASQNIDTPESDHSYYIYLEPNPNSCSAVSTSSTTSTQAEFVNLSNRKVRVVWHNQDGKEDERLPGFVLGPGDRIVQGTYLGHEWCVSDAMNGSLIQAVRIGEPRQKVKIR